jgi:hypothetical protein
MVPYPSFDGQKKIKAREKTEVDLYLLSFFLPFLLLNFNVRG